ncbi:hypothetical protein [Phenylobacterium sp.]|uniref:hypothetical protein n=1 Tax=Phenylobacterium sp. TaxID=1871053 RepID=UPI00391BA20D
MEDLFRSYWWLLFPLGFFAFGAWDRWLAYKRSQAQLDLLRSYAQQGKEPPADLLRAVREDEAEVYDAPPYGRLRRRMYRRGWRYGPYWAWRTALLTGAVALGFWLASEYADLPGVEAPFRLVAIILTCVAAGHLVVAVLSSAFRGR